MSRNEIEQVLKLEDSETVASPARAALAALLSQGRSKPARTRTYRADGDDRHERFRHDPHAALRGARHEPGAA